MVYRDASDPVALTASPGRLVGLYAIGFGILIVLLAILEQVGVPDRIIAYLFVSFTLAVYAVIGVLARTMRASEFLVAGRRIPARINAMAAAANWISGGSFVFLAGTLYALGNDGLAYVLGGAGGLVLVAVLIAPYLRKFGAVTVPDFLAARFGGGAARLVGVIVLVAASFVMLSAQLQIVGIVAARVLGIPYAIAVPVGLLSVLSCTLLGGMRSLTWTQVAQFIVVAAAWFVPVAALSVAHTGNPFAPLTYGRVLAEITAIEQRIGVTGANGEALASVGQFTSHLAPFSSVDPFNTFALVVCLIAGTASLPHLLARFFTTRSVSETRRSVAWTLVFVAAFLVCAPAYAAFIKLDVLQTLVGADIAALPQWVYEWGANGLGLVTLCGVAASDPLTVASACDAKQALAAADIAIDRDAIVLAAPEIAGLPFVIAGLVAAGALAAAVSTAGSLLVAIANALGNDVCCGLIERRAPTGRRLAAARAMLLAAAIGAAWLATARAADVLSVMAWSFSLAAAGNFPALVLGIWWKRCTSTGAVTGMLAGFGVTLLYLVATGYLGMPPLPLPGLTGGVAPVAAAILGLPVGFVVMILVSRMTPEPPPATLKLVDDIRNPLGRTVQYSGDGEG